MLNLPTQVTTFAFLKKLLQENGGAGCVSRADSDSLPSKPSTIRTQSADSSTRMANLPTLAVEGTEDARHCRSCSNLRLRPPQARFADSDGELMLVSVVNSAGKVYDMPVRRLSNQPYLVCRLKKWRTGDITSVAHIVRPGGYFHEQATKCPDYAYEPGQVHTLVEVANRKAKDGITK